MSRSITASGVRGPDVLVSPEAAGGPLGGDASLRVLVRLSSALGSSRSRGLTACGTPAITAALELHRGDARRVARFSRHAKLKSLRVYDDARLDEAGDVVACLEQHLAMP